MGKSYKINWAEIADQIENELTEEEKTERDRMY